MKPEIALRELGRRVLIKAGFKIGGEALARQLGVTDAQLAQWLEGTNLPPLDAVAKAIDVLEPTEPRHDSPLEVGVSAGSRGALFLHAPVLPQSKGD